VRPYVNVRSPSFYLKNEKKSTATEPRTKINVKRLRDEFSALVTSSERLWEFRPIANGQLQMPLVSATTITAFGCEIGLKYLATRSGGAWSNTHHLDTLFNALNTGLRDEIRHTINMSDQSIQASLKAAQSAFIEWRYFFEHDNEKITMMATNVLFLRNLLNALDVVVQKGHLPQMDE
jgi:hypothetical protein